MENRAVILLVEDDLALRQFLSGLLRRSGYTVLPASSAAEAIRDFTERNGRISLLLTDIDLAEGISGIRLAERLRAISPGLRIIAMSGSPEHSAAFRGVWQFVSKPFPPADLLRKIEEVLTAGAFESVTTAAPSDQRRAAVDRRNLA